MSQTLPPRSIANRRRFTLVTLCLATLVAQLDTAIVNLAAHQIGDYFHAGVNALQWVLDSYNLVYAVLLLTGGLLADLIGRRRIFLGGAAIFTAASILCASAPSIPILIVGRVLTGLGAALLIPASLAIIRVVWQDNIERGRALGIWAGYNGLAMAIGPTLGGLLIHRFGWRSIFLVVVPVGIAVMLLTLPSIPESSDPQGRHFDAPAQGLGALALGSLAFAAIALHDAPTIALGALAVAVMALALFIKTEARRGAAALVPLDIFRSGPFRGAIIATAGMTFGMYAVLFLLPLTWQSAGTLNAVEAGLALMPMALVFVIVSPFSGTLSGKFGLRAVTCMGVAIIAGGLVVVGVSAYQTSFILSEFGLVMAGIGTGIATGPLMEGAVGAVPAARSGTAAALVNVARMTGATMGVAIPGAVFAMVHGGAKGLCLAMILAGMAQMACVAVAWRSSAGRALQYNDLSETR